MSFGYRDGVHTAGAMNALLLPSGNTFIADTYVNDEPDAEELAEITLMAAETVRRFGIEPRVALLSHSNFGSSDCPSSSKMRQALELVRDRAPDLMIDGEMHGDAALGGSDSQRPYAGQPFERFCQYSGDAEHGSCPH
ncbi:NADP-dependent malic enzyme [Escherichia coli]|uniref:NADP-dependent malic enzyme n=1 Tax=Escherichia coli TaxID=562 RepID=A0A376RGD6_ECOLX|nr:NADP-dependent malic enzyme [Escherichia coli]